MLLFWFQSGCSGGHCSPERGHNRGVALPSGILQCFTPLPTHFSDLQYFAALQLSGVLSWDKIVMFWVSGNMVTWSLKLCSHEDLLPDQSCCDHLSYLDPHEQSIALFILLGWLWKCLLLCIKLYIILLQGFIFAALHEGKEAWGGFLNIPG